MSAKEFQVATTLVTMAALLGGCEMQPSTSLGMVRVNRTLLATLPDGPEKETQTKKLDYINNYCKNNVPAFIPGSEQAFPIVASDGRIFEYTFCNANDKDNVPKTVVVSYVEKGDTSVIEINHDLVAVPAITLNGQEYTEFGYVEPEANNKSYRLFDVFKDGKIVAYDLNDKPANLTDIQNAGLNGFFKEPSVVRAEAFTPTSLASSTPLAPQETNTPAPDVSTPTTQATATSIDTPVPTATPEKFSLEAISFVPKNESEIGKSVKVRSPIDDPAGYKEDMTAYMAKVHQILDTYDKEFLIIPGGTIGVGDGEVMLHNIELNPMASVYFDWGDLKVPILTLPAQDDNGKFGLNIVLDPTQVHVNKSGRTCNPSPDWKIDPMLRSFPSKLIEGCNLDFAYSNSSRLINILKTPFSLAYLKDKNPENNVLGDALWKWLFGDFSRAAETEAMVVIGYQ